MKKQQSSFNKTGKGILLAVLIGCFLSPYLHAQMTTQDYKDNDSPHYYDTEVLAGYRYIYVTAKGADGGKVEDGTNSDAHSGGEGAKVTAWLTIGNGPGEIPAGSTLRLIPGQKGGTRQKFAGGGGGTAVAFHGPNATDSWQLLLVAGGGGGAGSSYPGRPGTTGTSGSNGIGKYGDKEDNAGTDGYGAHHGGGAGGGALSNGATSSDDNIECVGKAGMSGGYPMGGDGGSGECIDPGTRGGFGFGGGGSGGQSSIERTVMYIPVTLDAYAGGGGGGYSGGGSGSYNGGGGGGGSYTNADWVPLSRIDGFNTTASPQNGYVSYYFSNTPPVKTIKPAKDQTKCIDDYAASTAKGNNIQLFHCSGNASQQWLFDGPNIRLVKDQNKCIDLDNSSTANNANIRLWDCNGTNAQGWFFDAATQAIRSAINPNKCLNVANGNIADQTNINLWDCDGTDAQSWIVEGITPPVLADTFNRIHFDLDKGKCLDLEKANPVNGANIQIYHCHHAASQYWHFDGNTIRYYAAQNKCLDLSNSNTANGANIQLYGCNGSKAQQWIYDSVNSVFRSGANPNKCLDLLDGNTADNSNIQLWDCQEWNTNQRFVISN